ncbi:MAG: hypothetical protein H7301_13810 [Cryobacterium sp.]|nr:hypothetical protein [Oligoflexia bacterium]
MSFLKRAHRPVVFALLLSFPFEIFAGSVLAAEKPNSAAPLDSVRFAQLRELRTRPVSAYFKRDISQADAMKAFRTDLDFFHTQAMTLGVFASDSASQRAWNESRDGFTAAQVRAFEGWSVASIAQIIYLKSADLSARHKDIALKVKRKPGVATPGDLEFADKIEKLKNNSIAQWIWGGIIVGGAVFLAAKVVDIFFHGPLTQFMNAALEPFIRPVRERFETFINTSLAPRFVGWAQFVSGENARREKAMAEAGKGGEISKDLERFSNPAISVEDFAADHEAFYDEFMKADYRWKGWITPQYNRARNTGFELIYGEWTSLGERISNYEANTNTLRLILAMDSRPELISAGASPSEVELFSKLIEQKQEIMVFEDPRSPKIPDLDSPLENLVKKWLEKGINSEKIQDYYDLSVSHFVSKTRPAFALAGMLDGERFYQEHTTALEGLDRALRWQEQAREMVGFYDLLKKYQNRIQRFYDRKGVPYDVGARIAQRGYPLGGPRKPLDAEAVRYCTDTLKTP